MHTAIRTRWAAIGAAIAVAVGGGGLAVTHAASSAGGPVFVAVTPCRLFDTRPAPDTVGPRATPIGADEPNALVQQVTGNNGSCSGIPSDARAVAMNVTTINATAPSFLTVYPADVAAPTASNLNYGPGSPPTPNKVDVKLSAAGQIKVLNKNGTVDVLADVVGYYVDHVHDDRYYTKAEIDAIVAAATSPNAVVPSGVTITGEHWFDSQLSGTGDVYLSVSFPRPGPISLNSTMVNFAPDAFALTLDDDSTCTGTHDLPSAPPGHVCIYFGSATAVTSAFGNGQVRPSGFLVILNTTGPIGGDVYLNFTWAYTAP